jgi:hypothetical protein
LSRLVSGYDQAAEGAAKLYVSTKMASKAPISTAVAIRSLRVMLTDCTLSDHELATLVAQAAIAEGLDVSFDGPAEDEGFPTFKQI